MHRSRALMRLERREEAVEPHSAVLRVELANAEALMGRGLGHYQAKRFKAAEANLAALVENRGDAPGHYLRACALVLLDRALKIDQSHAAARELEEKLG